MKSVRRLVLMLCYMTTVAVVILAMFAQRGCDAAIIRQSFQDTATGVDGNPRPRPRNIVKTVHAPGRPTTWTFGTKRLNPNPSREQQQNRAESRRRADVASSREERGRPQGGLGCRDPFAALDLRGGATVGSTASEVEGEERPRRDYISRLVKSTRARGNDTGGGVRVALGGRDKSDLMVRTKSTLILVGSFLAIIVQLKQTGCAILVAFLQWALFREGMAIVRDEVCEVLLETEKGGGNALRQHQWRVFWVLGAVMYGRLLVTEILGVAGSPSPWMASFSRWHMPACAALYVGVLLKFITSLKSPPLIVYQLGQFAAAHFACFLVLPSTLVSFSARAGLFWFVIASASVIINDIMAYICGRLFGRTPLTVLSPKKTREGFMGAAITTSLLGLLLGRYLGGVEWLASPRNVLLVGRKGILDVEKIFSRTMQLPWTNLALSRAEMHAFWIAMMASLVGPFGGFFASGIKRAYGIKDFGNTIPGHGGAGDRFDCQVMLLPLVYFYLKAFEPELKI